MVSESCSLKVLDEFNIFPFSPPSAYGFDLGVAHADDLPFLFMSENGQNIFPWTEEDDLTRRRMCEMWTNFAKSAMPTPPGETVRNIPEIYAQIGNMKQVFILAGNIFFLFSPGMSALNGLHLTPPTDYI